MTDAMHRRRLAPAPVKGAPALFVDRDGTVVDDPGYIRDPDAVRLLPGAVGTLRQFRDNGYSLVLVTNQSGIGRGYYGWEDYDRVAGRLRDLLQREGLILDGEYACGHSPEEGMLCGWRKPGPGMLNAAADDLDIAMSDSIMVGDKLSDVEAGAAAGCGRAAHVLTGHGAKLAEARKAWQLAIPLDLVSDIGAVRP